MKKNIFGMLAAALIALPAFAMAQDAEALAGPVKDQIERINKIIRQQGGEWVAGETNLSNLPREEWLYRVGLEMAPVTADPAPEALADDLPAALDWRDNGGNFVTAPRNQKKCGSCWAFAMTGGLESYSLLQQNRPGEDLDLSEQVMLSCSGAGSCNGGYLTATFLEKSGLPLEEAYPYTAANGACSSAAAGWQAGAYKIGKWGSVGRSVPKIKAALAKYGPLPTAMMVYEDFMHYKSGVYSYATGKKLGGHAVLLVGYNDEGQYFIVKNSWDKGWGEDGFFRIAYSQMSNAVTFGLSTIAYWPAVARGAAGAFSFDSDAAWRRVEAITRPVFD